MQSVASFDLNNMRKCNNVSSQSAVLVKIINLKIKYGIKRYGGNIKWI